MGKDQYIVGIDFGTLSVRSSVIRVRDGFERGTAVSEYKHQVMDQNLTASENEPLPPDFALQNPTDYIESLIESVNQAVKDSGVVVKHIIGIGVDFTSPTVLATNSMGVPLCNFPEFKNRPHAYAKLWKHHAADDQAKRLLKEAQDRKEDWLSFYGGGLSAENTVCKIMETYEKDRELYDQATNFVNAVDWIVWQLTDQLIFSSADTGFKKNYQNGKYPSYDYLESVSKGFGNMYKEKMNAPIQAIGTEAGKLSKVMAEKLGLYPEISVAVGLNDGHVTPAAVKAVRPGILSAILGTSGCYFINSEKFKEVPGMLGIVYEGVVENLWCFEAGQTSFGDTFAWFTKNFVPSEYQEEAKKLNLNLHEYLTRKCSTQKIGQHGLIALDWNNGNRSILCDASLSGLLIGYTLTTKPEDIYRALMEACAFGARKIIETMNQYELEINEIVVAGGMLKNKFFMQMLSDITRLPISITKSNAIGALGSAIYGAVAAGCYPNITTASDAMGNKVPNVFKPNEEKAAAYDLLYEQYTALYTLFGEKQPEIMHQLKKIQKNSTLTINNKN
ncbi:ribulokinase [Apibacter muscae]|uniref:ribulokinase n=1 Tax=Apibacter muscae TaxID=2509004 RepID=UPI0011ABDBA0|nr:ribulokinase [Apibacter muscae]TWP29954.1 ribulokinase [Apibacter muscae]